MNDQLYHMYEAGKFFHRPDSFGWLVATEWHGPQEYQLRLLEDGEYVVCNNYVGLWRKPKVNGVAYIAGPMRGLPLHNFPAFDAARDLFIARNFYVFNPADMDREVGVHENTVEFPPLFLREAMARDTTAVSRSTHVALLPGWEKSRGVRPEGVLGNELDLKFLEVIGQGTREIAADKVAGVIGAYLLMRHVELRTPEFKAA